MKLIEQKNEIINKLLRIKKGSVSKEEYLDFREFWNKRRDETRDVRNRREVGRNQRRKEIYWKC